MKEYLLTNSRFKLVVIILVLMWIGIMVFFYLKADEITKDPCSICSERMGEEVTCYTGQSIQLKRTYYPNGSIFNDAPGYVP